MAILFWKYKKCNYICIKQKTNSNIYSMCYPDFG